MTAKVEVLADSIGEGFNKKHRVLTFKLCYPRFVHSEYLTHRMLSRNSESSRAVPTNKKLKAETYTPIQFHEKAKGMGSGKPLPYFKNWLARLVWKSMVGVNKLGCRLLSKLNVAKQWSNRPLEWFSYIEVITTGTLESWEHFLSLRDHPDAQPEMQVLAKEIRKAIEGSIPNILRYQEWHIPYDVGSHYSLEERKAISAGLCAGVSYLNMLEIGKALELGRKLHEHRPSHFSPYEHQLQCMKYGDKYHNYDGWKSYRYDLERKLLNDS